MVSKIKTFYEEIHLQKSTTDVDVEINDFIKDKDVQSIFHISLPSIGATSRIPKFLIIIHYIEK